MARPKKEKELSRSDYVRQQVLKGKVVTTYDIRVELPELQKLTSEFHNIGSNLNQIAKHLNTGGARSQEVQEQTSRCISMLFELRKEVLKMAGDFHGNTETYRKQKC